MRDIYVGHLVSSNYLEHYGKGHDDSPPGRGSGRYPWGSGKRPKQNTSIKSGSVLNEAAILMKDPTFKKKVEKSTRKLVKYQQMGAYCWKLFCNATAVKSAIKLASYQIPVAFLANNPVTWPALGILAFNGKQIFDEITARTKNALLDRRIHNESLEIDKKTGFRKKSREFTPEEDMENVNPLFKTGYGGYSNNCMLCTSTYDMRRRGYDVKVKDAAVGYDNEALHRWYPKASIKRIDKDRGFENGKFSKNKYIKEIEDELLHQKNGSRGNLMFYWNIPIIRAGHSVVYEIMDNQIVIRDCQSNKTYTDINKYLKHCTDVEYVRLDNTKFDPVEIKECCR